MTIISELSDNPKFTINFVSQQTGILPVTLRAWERRHAVLSPYRSENRYRLYSERDVAILRWLKSRVDAGVPISNAAYELRSITHAGKWPELVPSAVLEKPPASPAARQSTMYYAKALFSALVKHDEELCGQLLGEVGASFDLQTALLEVCAPVMVEIGSAWYRGEIRVTTEHFASSYLRGKLLTLLQVLPSRRNLPVVLVGGAPGEQHEIGSLMLSVLLRQEGYRVEYLGPDLPLVDLADYASYKKPDMIVLSASLPDAAAELQRLPAMLKKLRSRPVFGFGGAAFNRQPKLQKSIDGVFLGETLQQALVTITQLMER